MISNEIYFKVPAMPYPVMKGKQQARDVKGNIIYKEQIVAKERPRFGCNRKTGRTFTYSNDKSVKFEKWVREHYFKAYPSNIGVFNNNTQDVQIVGEQFLGCKEYGCDVPCIKYRTLNFQNCKDCLYRRKNLKLELDIFLKDERHIDVDNIIKIVLDALNRVCFYDDTQFVAKSARLYTNADHEGLEISLSVIPTYFNVNSGTGVGTYSLTNLPKEAILQYLEGFLSYSKDNDNKLFSWIERCDSRKFVKEWINRKKGI